METGRAEPFDPQTGEIIEQAADGAIVPSAARSAGQFIDLMGDGHFSRQAYQKIVDLGVQVRELAEATGKKQKGKVTITIDVASEGELFELRPEIKVTAPKEPQRMCAAWQDEDGRFTRFPPNQRQMFGIGPSVRGPVKMS